MKIPALPFTVTDWSSVAATIPVALPDAASVMHAAARGGLVTTSDNAARIAAAITPALRAFDPGALRLPMAEEPSGWTGQAFASAMRV